MKRLISWMLTLAARRRLRRAARRRRDCRRAALSRNGFGRKFRDGGSPDGKRRADRLFFMAENAVLEDDVDALASPSVIAPGNVQQLAGWVQEETGGELFSIRVTEPYPSDWDACLSRANAERWRRRPPRAQQSVDDMSKYDTVFLGYPNWWYGRADGAADVSGAARSPPARTSICSAPTARADLRAAWSSLQRPRRRR